MISKKLVKLLAGVLTAGILFIPGLGFAADETDIEKIEKQLIQKETELLDPELRLDKLIVERAKLDGMGGWFQGSKKKELERQMAECQTKIDGISGQMKALQGQVQEMVYAVAYSYEQKGNFQKAIEYYLKVERQDDKVITRIASCYKAMKEYEQAIQWFLKLSQTDANLLEVVDCYKLDGRMKEAIYWLFKILEPFQANPAETTALQLIETYDYPAKKTDYPDFNLRLSDIYLRKATLNYPQNMVQSKADYSKAVELIAQGTDPKTASFAIMTRYQKQLDAALDMLDQQKEAAERNYENMLREARSAIEDAEHRLRRAEREAEDDYRRRLEYAQREIQQAERELQQAQHAATPSAQLIDQARQKLDQARKQYQWVSASHMQIVDDYVRPYRRKVQEARDNYDRIVRDRTEIIERYIAPYKQQVANARAAFEMIRTLHEGVYGFQ